MNFNLLGVSVSVLIQYLGLPGVTGYVALLSFAPPLAYESVVSCCSLPSQSSTFCLQSFLLFFTVLPMI